MLTRIILLIIGYCFGMFQTGYIYAKKNGIDIRACGSGNAGSTNVLRVMGLKAGVITFVGDFLKSLIPCLAVKLIFKENTDVLVLWTGLGVVLGHDFPIWLNFRGGKGIASSLAIAFVLDWRLGLLVLAVWGLIVLATKYVSLGSLIAFFVFFVYICIKYNSAECKILAFILTGLAIIRHGSNIKRLAKGNENKIKFRK